MNRDVFDKYLEQRYQKAGALTPGQKLAVLEQLEKETREEGRVPTGQNSVARVPVNHPAFQAALRGEEISLGGASVRKPSNNLFERLVEAPPLVRIGVLVGFVLVLTFIAALLMGACSAPRKAEPTPTPLPSETPTLPPSPTSPPPTLPPPTLPPPPPSPTPVLSLGLGGPAENTRDPASIEIAQRLFIVSRGEVSKEGKWEPQGPEWLFGTEVRRVFAVPYEQLQDAKVGAGDAVFVRTRGGSVITYIVRDVVRLQANQIETFFSLRPSLVVSLPLAGGDVSSVERIVIFGEAQAEEVAVESETTEYATYQGANAYTLGGVNLRENPGLKSRILGGLPAGAPVLIASEIPPVTVDDVVWVYVSSAYGYGWVSRQMITAP